MFCGEIRYMTKDGPVGSDLCWHSADPISQDARQLLHDCLDEWLNKSGGTGTFVVGLEASASSVGED